MTGWDPNEHPRGNPANAGQFTSRKNPPPQGALRPQVRHTHRLNRDELLTGLTLVIDRLHAAKVSASIQIIGGGAIALRYWPGRNSTQDLDAILGPRNIIIRVSEDVGQENGWPNTWMNSDAEGYLPPGFCRRSAEWETVHDEGGVRVQIATADTLLALKLHAANRRGRREMNDLAVLLQVCGITTLDDAENHYADFYGDDLTATGAATVESALATRIDGIRDEPVSF